jgi:hypothetical protein
MKQTEIMALLKEAAELAQYRNTNWRDIAKIQVMLGDAIYRSDDDSDGRAEGFEIVLDSLYTHCIQENPTALPRLFPFFALLCGDRTDMITTDEIEWSLYEEILK